MKRHLFSLQVTGETALEAYSKAHRIHRQRYPGTGIATTVGVRVPHRDLMQTVSIAARIRLLMGLVRMERPSALTPYEEEVWENIQEFEAHPGGYVLATEIIPHLWFFAGVTHFPTPS